MPKSAALSGLTVASARVEPYEREGETWWRWVVITDRTEEASGGYSTALAAGRSLVQALRRHAPEF
jgi:hypothetical protein